MCNKYRLVHECGHWTIQTRSLCPQAQSYHDWTRRAPGDRCPYARWQLDEHLRLKCRDCHRKWRKQQAAEFENRRKQALHLARRHPGIQQAIHERYIEEKSYFVRSLPRWEAQTEDMTGPSVYSRYPAEIERAFSGFVDLFHQMNAESQKKGAVAPDGNETETNAHDGNTCPGSHPDSCESGSTCPGSYSPGGSGTGSDGGHGRSGRGAKGMPSGSQSERRSAPQSGPPLDEEEEEYQEDGVEEEDEEKEEKVEGGSSRGRERDSSDRRRGWRVDDFSAWFRSARP
ncbi:hypothetical protein VTH06DRAFT_6742 [Thermothelomyces fergusii]